MSDGTGAQLQPENSLCQSPGLLCELEPWHRVFARNFKDLFRPEPPPLELSSEPVELRPDYFIATGIGPRRFLESGSYHLVAVAIIYFVSVSPLFRPRVKLHSGFEDTKVEYYPVSEYLPPLNSQSAKSMKPRKGAPKLAKQEILSVPPEPDNFHQTIVTPPNIKLTHDVALPNIVAWTAIPAAQPIAASSRNIKQRTVQQFDPQVVEPTADLSHTRAKLEMPTFQQTVVEPAADLSHLKAKLNAPALPQPAVVEPALSANQMKLRPGDINMAQVNPQLAAPKLPVAAQQAASAGGGAVQQGKNPGAGAPPSPNVQNLPSHGQGQLIALGLNPTVGGPVNVPNGNRSGEFHASPSGKPDAPGTPNVRGTGTDANTAGGHGSANGVPAGIMVGAPPAGSKTSAVAGTPSNSSSGPVDAETQRRILAAAMSPTVPSVNRRPAPTPEDDFDRPVEEQIFGKRPYYALVMNMPNLTSATGSWIIHFAELQQTGDKTVITAPVAVTKVDPAYPADVLRDRVEGTVTLYAVIHADGSVGDVRVLNSVDDRLDQTAIRALRGWHFRPGTKHGEPVELEAVVQIPFRMTKF